MHFLHAVCRTRLHHVTVAVGHLRSIWHPDPPLRREGCARPILRCAAPLIMALVRRCIALSKRRGNRERGGGSRNDGGRNLERLHDTIPLANNRGLAVGLALRAEVRRLPALRPKSISQGKWEVRAQALDHCHAASSSWSKMPSPDANRVTTGLEAHPEERSERRSPLLRYNPVSAPCRACRQAAVLEP